MARARRIQQFLSQNTYMAEKFTGVVGSTVPLTETVEAFAKIADGEFDHISEQAFFNIGGLEDLERNWARIQKELRRLSTDAGRRHARPGARSPAHHRRRVPWHDIEVDLVAADRQGLVRRRPHGLGARPATVRSASWPVTTPVLSVLQPGERPRVTRGRRRADALAGRGRLPVRRLEPGDGRRRRRRRGLAPRDVAAAH